MNIDKSKVKKILFITLSNIGDVILTLPVLGVLKKEFPAADITVMVGPNAKELFEAERSVSKIIAYDKHASVLEKLRLGLKLRKDMFDMVVDLRNSLFPLLIGAKYNTPLTRNSSCDMLHRKDKHLNILRTFGIVLDDAPFSISFNNEDRLHVHSLLKQFGILPDDKIVAVSAGAKSHTKRWTIRGFIEVCDRLSKEMGSKVLLIGDDNDRAINKEIVGAGLKGVYDITGHTNLRELSYLLSLCKLLITNDSAPLHIASSLNIPTVAIFGPTDYKKYGPLSANSIIIRKNLACIPCEKAQCRFNLECMREISSDEVFNTAKELLLKIRH